jgi:hypothetical protein
MTTKEIIEEFVHGIIFIALIGGSFFLGMMLI